MGNSFVLFDVSIVISHGQFHCGNRGHTQNADFPWVKSHFPVGKRSSGTTANKYFIDRASSVRVRVRPLFTLLWTSTSSRSIKTQNENSANIQPS